MHFLSQNVTLALIYSNNHNLEPKKMKSFKKLPSIFTIGLCLILLSFHFIFAYTPSPSKPIFTKSTFHQLPHWKNENPLQAFQAFKLSCAAILKLEAHTDFHPTIHKMGQTQDWQTICLAANRIKQMNEVSIRQFFESWFEPYAVSDRTNREGLFTGYYLPVIQGSLKPNQQAKFPIYGIPQDLIKIDLGLFHPDLTGKTIVGRVKDNALQPYYDRSAINQGNIHAKTPVLAWGNSLVDIFFAQIQGSAIVQLDHKKQLLIGYAGSNGHPYTSIGKILIETNELSKENISMQSIRDWLTHHPNEAKTMLNHNASFVFFKILKETSPLGTEQVPLTPRHSLAVDTRYISLGTPVWLDTTLPRTSSEHQSESFRHLLIAQDTGGAIKGIVRGDIYLGSGQDAAFVAGHMKNPGQYWILLPRRK